MAQMQKFTLRQAKHIIAHVERTGATHSNKQIDMERTQYNYALWPHGDPDRLVLDTEVRGQSSGRYAYQRLKKRLSEVSWLKRDDVNVLVSWCIHLGVDVPPGYDSERQFFEAAVRFIAEEYGAENLVYAWVHKDEEKAHLHVGFVPVVEKKLKLRKNASEATRKEYEEAVAAGKTTVERVDADQVINLKHLQGWHPRFSAWMSKWLGYDPGVHTGITQAMGGNMSVNQLKSKPSDWRENRNKRTAAYHANRRAEKDGQKPSLDDRIILTAPKPQAPEPPKKMSLDELLLGAKKRAGK